MNLKDMVAEDVSKALFLVKDRSSRHATYLANTEEQAIALVRFFTETDPDSRCYIIPNDGMNGLSVQSHVEEHDSRQETIEHIMRVRELLYIVQNKLEARGFAHDQTKLGPNEKPIFDRVTGKLKGLTYGSDEYKASLKELGPALKHHYEHNTHHPEHYQNGVDGMSLLDVIEMLCDWKAAGERHADGSIMRSLAVNRNRFQISNQLYSILENTVRELGWDDRKPQTNSAPDAPEETQ